jgi:hypothetical protein
MSVSLTEDYSDNFFLSERDPEEEFRTGVSIGTVFRKESARSFVSLANTISGYYDVRSDRGNIGFANVALNIGHQLPRLALAVSESFIRSDDVPDATPTGVRSERRTFLRNSVSPQFRYDLSPVTAVNGAYTYSLVRNADRARDSSEPVLIDGRRVEGNSTSHAFTGGLQHWFTQSLSGNMNYTYTTIDSEDTPDTRSHAIGGNLGYNIDARTTAIFQSFANIIDRQDGAGSQSITERDAQVYGVSFGVRRQLTSLLSAFVAIGPTLVKREDRAKRLFANWQASLDGALPLTRQTTLRLSTQQSINDTAGDIDDVGLVRSQSVALILDHTLTRNMVASLFANYTRSEVLEDLGTDVSTQDRDFDYWSTGATLTYALTRVLSLGVGYRYQHRESSVTSAASSESSLGRNYSENRFTVSLSAAFPLF